MVKGEYVGYAMAYMCRALENQKTVRLAYTRAEAIKFAQALSSAVFDENTQKVYVTIFKEQDNKTQVYKG